MIMYQGQTTFSSHDVSLEEDETAQAISTRVVMTLARTMRSKSSVIYADNFFSSIDLVRLLKKKLGTVIQELLETIA